MWWGDCWCGTVCVCVVCVVCVCVCVCVVCVVCTSGCVCVLPELLDEVLSLLDDVDGHLQRGLLLLAKPLDQVLDRLHRLSIHIIQQLLLEILQPCPQLHTHTHTHTESDQSWVKHRSI